MIKKRFNRCRLKRFFVIQVEICECCARIKKMCIINAGAKFPMNS